MNRSTAASHYQRRGERRQETVWWLCLHYQKLFVSQFGTCKCLFPHRGVSQWWKRCTISSKPQESCPLATPCQLKLSATPSARLSAAIPFPVTCFSPPPGNSFSLLSLDSNVHLPLCLHPKGCLKDSDVNDKMLQVCEGNSAMGTLVVH